jgi:hypothetical protein
MEVAQAAACNRDFIRCAVCSIPTLHQLSQSSLRTQLPSLTASASHRYTHTRQHLAVRIVSFITSKTPGLYLITHTDFVASWLCQYLLRPPVLSRALPESAGS